MAVISRWIVHVASAIMFSSLLFATAATTVIGAPSPPLPMPVPVPSLPAPQPIPASPQSPHRTPGPRGVFGVDLPDRIELNQHFDLDIWLEPEDPTFNSMVEVFMERTDKVGYAPRKFDLLPGRRFTVGARVKKARSGLAEVIASASGWKPLFVSVDVGFVGSVSSRQLDDPIEGGTIRSFTLNFIDTSKNPISLDAPISLIIQAPGARVRQNSNDPWSSSISAPIRRGATGTPAFEISPFLRGAGKRSLNVEARINDSRTIMSQPLDYTVVLPWWALAAIAVFGALLYAPFHSGRRQETRLMRVLAFLGIMGLDAIAGGLAYVVATLNLLEVVGLNLATSRPQGFFLLGFIFARVGVEQILRRFEPADARSADKASDRGQDGQQTDGRSAEKVVGRVGDA